MNDFYFELAVRVVEVCRDTRAENGGLMAVEEIVKRVQKGRGIGGGIEVSEYVVFHIICKMFFTYDRMNLKLIPPTVMISYVPSSHSNL